jgi:hypothetical protein
LGRRREEALFAEVLKLHWPSAFACLLAGAKNREFRRTNFETRIVSHHQRLANMKVSFRDAQPRMPRAMRKKSRNSTNELMQARIFAQNQSLARAILTARTNREMFVGQTIENGNCCA